MDESAAPSKRTSPCDGASTPASRRISVDFPQPFAPIKPPTAPRGNESETPATAGCLIAYAKCRLLPSRIAPPAFICCCLWKKLPDEEGTPATRRSGRRIAIRARRVHRGSHIHAAPERRAIPAAPPRLLRNLPPIARKSRAPYRKPPRD